VRRQEFSGAILNRDVIAMICKMVWVSRNEPAVWRRAQSEWYEFVMMMTAKESTMRRLMGKEVIVKWRPADHRKKF
jgi:hypothetical protein